MHKQTRSHAGAAFLSYLAGSVLIFGRGVLVHPASSYIGQGPDPQVYIWFLAWWAHALSHHLNPLLPKVVWAPSGGNLAWACDFPLAACLLYPVTRLWGPIVSFRCFGPLRIGLLRPFTIAAAT